LLKFKWFDDAGVRQRYTTLFAEYGIAPERIEMLGWTPQTEHLKCYGRIDLALDTFPYTGGVTTCEALLMGVPVVTSVGATFASRQSYSHLSNVGLSELCARDVPDYIDRAVLWASDPNRLAQLRNHLRQQLLDSPLCNTRKFASHLTDALESMWETKAIRPAAWDQADN
jgi:protein O-GlcNAc transferase